MNRHNCVGISLKAETWYFSFLFLFINQLLPFVFIACFMWYRRRGWIILRWSTVSYWLSSHYRPPLLYRRSSFHLLVLLDLYLQFATCERTHTHTPKLLFCVASLLFSCIKSRVLTWGVTFTNCPNDHESKRKTQTNEKRKKTDPNTNKMGREKKEFRTNKYDGTTITDDLYNEWTIINCRMDIKDWPANCPGQSIHHPSLYVLLQII